MKRKKPKQMLTTTSTSLEILEYIQQRNSARLTDVAEDLDMAKSTVHKHLSTLEYHGYLTREGNRYDIGFKLVNLGEYVKSTEAAFHRADQVIHTLAQATEEECSFGVEDHGRLLTIHEAYNEKAMSEDRRAGSYHYLHATAAGKAILAELPERDVDSIIERWGLPAKTEHTITTRETLEAELADIRKRGFAINDEESLTGLRAVGVTVARPDGNLLGAIDVSGPTYRLDGEVLYRDIPQTMTETRDDLEREIASQ